MQRIPKWGWVVFFLFLFCVACVTTPETGRKAFIITSESQEDQMGLQAYREVLAKGIVSHNARWTEVVNRVGSRIAQAAHRPDYRWQFTLLESKEMNAFCLPGGKVAVYTGILPVAQNEASLAAILGHEVAHATARHGGQRMTLALGAEAVTAVAELLSGKPSTQKSLVFAALGLGTQVGVMLPFSRSNEAEADEIGLIYMARAGYDPNEAVRFWDRFSKIAGSGGPSFLSDHPPSPDRKAALQKELPSVMPLYEASPKYGAGASL